MDDDKLPPYNKDLLMIAKIGAVIITLYICVVAFSGYFSRTF